MNSIESAGTSVYVPMSDGTRLAVTVVLPDEVPTGGVSTMLRSTRYWRSSVGNPAVEAERTSAYAPILEAGHAYVALDVRGTGASFGVWDVTVSEQEGADIAEVIDWIAGQPFSNGRVTTFGVSYEGTTAIVATLKSSAALVAVVPRFVVLDRFAHRDAPGGVPDKAFSEAWARAVMEMDGVREAPGGALSRVRPVDADVDGALLAEARLEHRGNEDPADLLPFMESRDQNPRMAKIDEVTSSRWARYRAHARPTWIWTGWYDSAFVVSCIALLDALGDKARITIGPWGHGAASTSLGSQFQPDAPMAPTPGEQYRQITEWSERVEAGRIPSGEPRVQYYVLGEERWHTAETWPPPGVQEKTLHLGADSLGDAAPAPAGEVSFGIDFAASSGTSNRYWGNMALIDIRYDDRAALDRTLAVFETAPLDEDVTIAGTATFSLQLATDRTDGAIFAYLEDVAPDGTVTYVTEGVLRLLHRRVDSNPPYRVDGPYHSMRAADAQLMTPNVLEQVEGAFYPVAARFAAGHRIRLAIAGADDGVFRRIPAEGDATWRIGYGEHGSKISLPVLTAPSSEPSVGLFAG